MISEYFKERAKWKKLGKPTRTEEEMGEIFRICQACPNYKKSSDDAGECGVCGCGIKRFGSKMYKFLNKIFWGSTRCPLPEPKWIESEPQYSKNVKVSGQDIADAEKEHNAQATQMKQKKKKKPCKCGRSNP